MTTELVIFLDGDGEEVTRDVARAMLDRPDAPVTALYPGCYWARAVRADGHFRVTERWAASEMTEFRLGLTEDVVGYLVAAGASAAGSLRRR